MKFILFFPRTILPYFKKVQASFRHQKIKPSENIPARPFSFMSFILSEIFNIYQKCFPIQAKGPNVKKSRFTNIFMKAFS